MKKQRMHLLEWDKISSLDELNFLLHEYLEKEYHQTVHSSINAKPIERFMEDIDLLKYMPNQQELDFIFLHRVQRKVRKDATISLNRVQFEVPQVFIGERVHVRFHPNSLQKAYLFSEDNKIIDTIYPFQKIDNSRIYRQKKTGVDFAIFNPMEMEES